MYKRAEEYFEGDKTQQLKSKWENDLFKRFGNFTDRTRIVLFDVNTHDGKWPTAFVCLFVRSFKNERFRLCSEGPRLSSHLGHRLTTFIYFAILLRLCGQMTTELAKLKLGHEIFFLYPSKFVFNLLRLIARFSPDLFLFILSIPLCYISYKLCWTEYCVCTYV
jgi:hypothetical protein